MHIGKCAAGASFFGLAIGGGVAPTGNVAQAQEAARGIEEVVVTARRREENLQDIPLSITAFGSDQLEQQNITNMENLNTSIPNIAINGGGVTGPSDGTFHMRGIPGVAVYVDGVAKTGAGGLLLDVVELERVEVLRGPQGTLFGKNAIGGAIQFVTQKPREEFGARIKTTFGSYDRRDVIVNADIPLSDTLFAKVTGASVERGGFVDSQVIDKSFGSTETEVARGMLLWRPTDRFEALFSYETNDWTTNGQAEISWDINAPPYAAAGFDVSNETHSYGAREEFKNTMDLLTPGGFNLADNFVIDVSYDLSDSLTLRSITGGRDLRHGNQNDLDGTEHDIFQQWFYSEREEFSEELQLLFSGERVSGTAGLYYFSDENANRTNRWLNVDLNELGLWGDSPFNFDETQGLPPGWRNDGGRDETDGWAVFGEFTFTLTDRLALTAGVRHTEEDAYSAACPNLAVPIGRYPLELHEDVSCSFYNVDGTADFSNTSPRVSLQYTISPDIMVYGTYSEGFGAGGFDFNSAVDPDNLLPYTSEVLKNWELGWRSDLLDNRLRLNVTAFFGTWEDIQVAAEITPATLTTINAGEAEIKGFEIDGQWAPTDNFR
ncbi:MAG: TonB-dependent receptor, partial [Gammaproteobacteria bacterium]|nr:TonB-dependent receptor [Gammaproteobacteria bacterium]